LMLKRRRPARLSFTRTPWGTEDPLIYRSSCVNQHQ
jgi:hypothetical protein